jgi:predicted negative regulator of RcsB-dependent stress response
MNFIVANKWLIVGVILGSLGGFAYYYFIGCAAGSCAITSKPLNSTLYGALLGGLFASLIFDGKKK